MIKILLAAKLDLHSDEVFYWLASTRLAPAYSDLPFMSALLVWLGSGLEPQNTLAVRSMFLLMGSSIPLLIFWLALPITDTRQALISAIFSLCIPLGGFLGLLAVPDVPLVFFGLLAMGFFERSLRTDKAGYWLGTGVAVALGLSTHYRFFLYPAAAMLFLLFHGPERRQFRNLRFWSAAGIAGLGLIPIIWFNLDHQLASAGFYLVERHPWEFQPSGLLHIIKQAGVVTPPLYALLAIALWQSLQRVWSGDRNAALLAGCALMNLLVYLVLAPWTDPTSTTIHWPLSGYFPLLVFVPRALDSVRRWTQSRWNRPMSQTIVIGIPGLGYLGSIVAIFVIGSQLFQAPLQAVVGTGVLSNKMAGWREFTEYTGELLLREFSGGSPVIVTDNYYTAAQLMFAGVVDNVLTIDNDKAVRDGRRLQLALWDMDESALSGSAGKPMLFITEDSTLNILEKETVIGEMCRHVENPRHLATLSLFNGDKQFSYYIADRIAEPSGNPHHRVDPCPYPARAWIDPPRAGAVLEGVTHIEGWAYNADIGIDSVYLLLNDEAVAELQYGIGRPDVVEVMAVKTDPNAPNLGFSHELDTRNFPNGRYRLAIRLIDQRGVTSSYGARPVEIKN